MSDVSQGEGWWLASDGKWYPPEQRPQSADALGTPNTTGDQPAASGAGIFPGAAPSGISTGPLPAGPSLLDLPGQDPQSRVSFTSWKTGVPAPQADRSPTFGVPSPSLARLNPASAGSGAMPVSASSPPSAVGIPGFDDNPFAKRTRGTLPPPRKKKGRLTIPVMALIFVVIAGGAITAGYMLTHPSPRRSASAVAVDFYKQISNSNWSGAASDVEPSQQAAASSMGSMPELQSLAKQLNTLNLSATSLTVKGNETLVSVQACNISLACLGTPDVPVVEIAKSWYVDWQAWQESLAQQ